MRKIYESIGQDCGARIALPGIKATGTVEYVGISFASIRRQQK